MRDNAVKSGRLEPGRYTIAGLGPRPLLRTQKAPLLASGPWGAGPLADRTPAPSPLGRRMSDAEAPPRPASPGAPPRVRRVASAQGADVSGRRVAAPPRAAATRCRDGGAGWPGPALPLAPAPGPPRRPGPPDEGIYQELALDADEWPRRSSRSREELRSRRER